MVLLSCMPFPLVSVGGAPVRRLLLSRTASGEIYRLREGGERSGRGEWMGTEESGWRLWRRGDSYPPAGGWRASAGGAAAGPAARPVTRERECAPLCRSACQRTTDDGSETKRAAQAAPRRPPEPP